MISVLLNHPKLVGFLKYVFFNGNRLSLWNDFKQDYCSEFLKNIFKVKF